MKALDYLSKQSPVSLAVAGVAILAGLYWIGRQAVKDTAAAAGEVAGAAGGIISGNNVITQNQTNSAGEKTTAYEGAGVLGTLGASVNSALGGVPASIGEKIGGWAFDIFGPKSPN